MARELPQGVESEIKTFRTIFAQGLSAIEDAKRVTPTPGNSYAEEEKNKRIMDAAVVATKNLLSTPYVSRLWQDVVLQEVFIDLEKKLGTLVKAMLQDPSKRWPADQRAVQWSKAAHCKAEREFLFWGRLSEILIYYCDEGQNFGATLEAANRQTTVQRGEEMIASIQAITDQPVCKLYYDMAARQRMQATVAHIREFQAFMNQGPSAYPDAEEPLLEDSFTIIRTQFIESVSRLCLELFGNLTTSQIRTFLRLRPESDASHGYIAWPGFVKNYNLRGPKVRTPKKLEDLQTFDRATVTIGKYKPSDQKKVIRLSYSPAFARARLVASEEDWPTKDIIAYFGEHNRR